MKHFKGFKRLSLSIVLCVLSAALLLTIAGCRKEPKSVYGVSEFKPGEHYVDFFYVEFVNSEGFGGSGDIKGEVFVKYPGADMYDLIEIMERDGAINAANLDGGTSTVLVVDGELVNDPIDGDGRHQTRMIATAIYLEQ